MAAWGLSALLLALPAEAVAQWCGDGVLDPDEACEGDFAGHGGGQASELRRRQHYGDIATVELDRDRPTRGRVEQFAETVLRIGSRELRIRSTIPVVT